jgi:hypothetical protein
LEGRNDLGQGNGLLLAGGEGLDLDDALGEVPLSEDERVAGAGAVGRLHRALDALVAVREVGRNA